MPPLFQAPITKPAQSIFHRALIISRESKQNLHAASTTMCEWISPFGEEHRVYSLQVGAMVGLRAAKIGHSNI